MLEVLRGVGVLKTDRRHMDSWMKATELPYMKCGFHSDNQEKSRKFFQAIRKFVDDWKGMFEVLQRV